MKLSHFIALSLSLYTTNVFAQQPIDKQVTSETKSLYTYLFNIKGRSILFGHQDELLVGSNHKRGTEGSDTYDIIMDYPALYGFNLANVEQNGKLKNTSDISFKRIKEKIIYIYDQGGIITLTWSVNNPVVPQLSSKSQITSNTVQKLFIEPESKKRYNVWLDKLVVFFKSLKSKSGTPIPILFRPFHENNGSWFWWGTKQCSAEEYIQLWRYTVDYLRSKGVHNLLYVYSTDKFKNSANYLKRYPGDNYVDVLGFDCYDSPGNYPGNKLLPNFQRMVQMVSRLAEEKGKVAALTETGFKNMPVKNWWTNTLYKAINGSHLSYVMVWGNYGKRSNTFWGTYKGQISANDFKKFAKYPSILFLSNVTKNKVYKNN